MHEPESGVTKVECARAGLERAHLPKRRHQCPPTDGALAKPSAPLSLGQAKP